MSTMAKCVAGVKKIRLELAESTELDHIALFSGFAISHFLLLCYTQKGCTKFLFGPFGVCVVAEFWQCAAVEKNK